MAESREGDSGVGAEKASLDVAEEIGSSLLREGNPGKSSWPSFLQVPIGNFPAHWGDGLHDGDGHGLRSGARDLEGETLCSIYDSGWY